MKKTISRMLTICVFMIIFFSLFLSEKFKVDAQTAVNVKCSCSTQFSSCTSFGTIINSKYRRCTLNSSGAQTCNYKLDTKYYQVQSCATPTVTPGGPTPTPGGTGGGIGSITAITPGTDDLCTSMTLSADNLAFGGNLTITAKASTNDITKFAYEFYNLDNLDSSGQPKPIRFTATGVLGTIKNVSVASDTNAIGVDFTDIDHKDLNWNYYMNTPNRIRVDAYFSKVGTTTWSKFNSNCSKSFHAQTVDPTPTINPSCTCGSTNSCAAACFFDKFGSGVTPAISYSSPIKCGLGGVFSSVPTSANKTQWCRNYLRTKGDANGDGQVTFLDYFYYVAVRSGAKVPPTINVDFDGNNVVSDQDKVIIIKKLKP